MTRRAPWLLLAAAAAAVAGACSGGDLASPPADPPASPPPAPVRIDSLTVVPNTTNTLAASIAVVAQAAESARVVFAAPGGPADSTPSVALAGGRGTVQVLGLRSGVGYRGVVQVSGAAGRAESDSVSITGGELPEALRNVSLATSGTGTRGLTMRDARARGHALRPRVRLCGRDPLVPRLRLRRPPGHRRPQAAGERELHALHRRDDGLQPVPGHYVEFSPSGDSLRTLAAPAPLYTDNHELLITGSGADERVHLFGYDRRSADLSAVGGPDAAEVAGHSVLRLLPDGSSEFAWSGWDHLGVEDWIEPPAPDPASPVAQDFDHPNSLAFDRDGNYIVSWRNIGEVTKIDAGTGDVLWRLGGAHNQFSFVDDPLQGFSAQHYARILPDGHLLLYDNGTRHQPQETRVVEYALDLAAHTATLVWEFRHEPAIYTPYVGAVQRLVSGNTAIGYGGVGHVTEVTPDGSVVWEADLRVNGQPAFVYRRDLGDVPHPTVPDRRVPAREPLHRPDVRRVDRRLMPELPHQRRRVGGGVERVLDHAGLLRLVARAVVVEQQVAVGQDPRVVLGAEPLERVVHEAQLVVGAAQAPEHIACTRVDLGHLAEVRHRHDVVAVPVERERVGMVEVLRDGARGVRRRRLDPVLDAEMVPSAPGELARAVRQEPQHAVAGDLRRVRPAHRREVGGAAIVAEQVEPLVSARARDQELVVVGVERRRRGERPERIARRRELHVVPGHRLQARRRADEEREVPARLLLEVAGGLGAVEGEAAVPADRARRVEREGEERPRARASRS